MSYAVVDAETTLQVPLILVLHNISSTDPLGNMYLIRYK